MYAGRVRQLIKDGHYQSGKSFRWRQAQSPKRLGAGPCSKRLWALAGISWVALGWTGTVGAQSTTGPDFRREVLPILSNHCFACHGPDANTRAADLRLDDIPALLALESSVIVAGAANMSELVQRIESGDPAERMPPDEHKRPLSIAQKETLRRWIENGARTAPHWAFERPQRPDLPSVKEIAWVRNPIDQFVLARLEQEGLAPSAEADRATLLRRLSLDLIGLPPTPEEVADFERDSRPDFYEQTVERLMASPHYGERMAMSWLDAARYADSNGFQQDGDTYQYVWRDWVIAALNQNLPFDRFTVEQLAGDLMPNPSHDQIVATAFNRCHLLNGEGGAIAEEQRHVILFDRVDVTATNWLGLTLACAQCHDHKYDPLTQRDYYSFLAFFNNVPESGVPPGGGQYRIAEPFVYSGSPEDLHQLEALENQIRAGREELALLEQADDREGSFVRWLASLAGSEPLPAEIPHELVELACLPEGERQPEQTQQLRTYYLDQVAGEPLRTARREMQGAIQSRDQLQNRLPRVMVMSDSQPRSTYILQRGNYEQPLDRVTADVPLLFSRMEAEWPRNRLGLAEWLVSPDNPLVARVQVNRIWQHYWGRGLVSTPENFGLQGALPTHPELLDWLAVEFRESGWDWKQLHRLVVNSATYRQSSRVSEVLLRRDPDNELLARGARFRLPAMLLRDLALAASGSLDRRIGGPPVYPYQPADIWDSLAITKERDFSYPQSREADLYRRSLYTFWRRTVAPGNMFDAGSRQACKVRVTITNTPLHALTTLNDTTWVEAARLLAAVVMQEHPAADSQISAAFLRVCGRRPGATELAILLRQLERNRQAFSLQPHQAQEFLSAGSSRVDARIDPIELAALSNVCLTILNLDEALSRE